MKTLQRDLSVAVAHHRAGRLANARRLYRQILRKAPRHADALHLLGVLAHQSGDHEEAAGLIRRALAVNADVPAFHYNLGTVLMAQGRHDDAIACLRRALALRPDYVEAHNHLGAVLAAGGALDEAIASYRRALALSPDCVEALVNLGNALSAQGHLEEGIASYRRALAVRPDDPVAHGNLGNALVSRGDVEEGIASYRRALAARPDYAEAHNNLGNAFIGQGHVGEGLASYRRALAARPDYAEAHSNLIFALDFDPRTTPSVALAERRRWNEIHALPRAAHRRPHANDPDPDRPLRIGYVSADFRRHSAAVGFGPVIFGHDRRVYEIICYSGVTQPDEATARFREAAAGWRSTLGVPDEALARTIRADRIDILVDLAGHSAGNRLPVFAMRPAPIQCTAWGYAAGTGLDAMDYLLADPLTEPPETRGEVREEIVEVPALTAYDPLTPSPEVNALPALAHGATTFGCFNRPAKVSGETLAAWAEILDRVPGSTLLLKYGGLDRPDSQARVLGALIGRGVAPERIRFLGGTSAWDHLTAYGLVDLGLDPFPHGGNITAMDALWMGVPSMTLRGTRGPGRMCASLLASVGLDDFVAATPAEYVERAVAHARGLERLARLRAELRPRFAASPSCDHDAYCRAVEAAYRAMWKRWCAHRRGASRAVK